MKSLSFAKLTILLCLAFALSACSTVYTPAPIGDELVWTSNEDGRPGWSVEAPEIEDGDYLVFVGQSLYHSTERGARVSAESNAAAQAALYLSRNAKQTYIEQTDGSAMESDVQDPSVTISSTTEVSADEVLVKMVTDEWYLENWRKDGQKLWKAFAKVRLPKARF